MFMIRQMLPAEPKRKQGSSSTAVASSDRAKTRELLEQVIASGDKEKFEDIWSRVSRTIRRRKKFMHMVLRNVISNTEGDWFDIFKMLIQGIVGKNSLIQFFQINEFRDTLIQVCVAHTSFSRLLTDMNHTWYGQDDLIHYTVKELASTFVQTQKGLEELLRLSRPPGHLSDNVLSQIDLALRLTNVRRQLNFDEIMVASEPLSATIDNLDQFFTANIQVLKPDAETWSHIISMGLPQTCQTLREMDDFDGLSERIAPLKQAITRLGMNRTPKRKIIFKYVFEFFASMQYPLKNIIDKLPESASVIISQYYNQNEIDALMLESIEMASPSGLKVSLGAGANPILPPLIHRPLPLIMVYTSQAFRTQRQQMYAMLIDAGANAETKNTNGKTLLYLERNNKDAMQFFLNKGVGDVFTIQEFRQLPIQELESALVLQVEDYMQGEDTTTFPCRCKGENGQCNHIFNAPFLHTWLNTDVPNYGRLQNTCPLCRQDIESIEILSKTSVDELNTQPAEAHFKQFIMYT